MPAWDFGGCSSHLTVRMMVVMNLSQLVRWMDLEFVMQSEVSPKEENKYRILTRVYGI